MDAQPLSCSIKAVMRAARLKRQADRDQVWMCGLDLAQGVVGNCPVRRTLPDIPARPKEVSSGRYRENRLVGDYEVPWRVCLAGYCSSSVVTHFCEAAGPHIFSSILPDSSLIASDAIAWVLTVCAGLRLS